MSSRPGGTKESLRVPRYHWLLCVEYVAGLAVWGTRETGPRRPVGEGVRPQGVVNPVWAGVGPIIIKINVVHTVGKVAITEKP